MVTCGWFICPSVSMVTTSKATGLEKTCNQYRLGIKGLITLCVVSLAFLIFFSRKKHKENASKLPNPRKMREHFSILHYALG